MNLIDVVKETPRQIFDKINNFMTQVDILLGILCNKEDGLGEAKEENSVLFSTGRTRWWAKLAPSYFGAEPKLPLANKDEVLCGDIKFRKLTPKDIGAQEKIQPQSVISYVMVDEDGALLFVPHNKTVHAGELSDGVLQLIEEASKRVGEKAVELKHLSDKVLETLANRISIDDFTEYSEAILAILAEKQALFPKSKIKGFRPICVDDLGEVRYYDNLLPDGLLKKEALHQSLIDYIDEKKKPSEETLKLIQSASRSVDMGYVTLEHLSPELKTLIKKLID